MKNHPLFLELRVELREPRGGIGFADNIYFPILLLYISLNLLSNKRTQKGAVRKYNHFFTAPFLCFTSDADDLI